jgi:hypothetical protein
VQRDEETREQLAVGVERNSDRTDREVAPAQHRRVMEGRSVECAVRKPGGDEQPGVAMEQPPALVAPEDTADSTDDRRIAQRTHERPQT